MTFAACSAIAGTQHSAFNIVPIFWMWVYPQATAGAVALDAHITIGMARLASNQVLACFTGMAAGPLMGGENGIDMTNLALVFIEAVMCRASGSYRQAAEAALM